jgi:hypothetical protein
MLPKVANDNSKAERWVEAVKVVKRQQKKWKPNVGSLMLHGHACEVLPSGLERCGADFFIFELIGICLMAQLPTKVIAMDDDGR